MTTDTAHSLIGSAALVMLAGGAAMAWGIGYALLIVGGVLLAGVVYARIATT